MVINTSKKQSRRLYQTRRIRHTAVGMTELGGVAAAQMKGCAKIESVGFVVPNVQVKVIDEASNEALGPHGLGEICVKSDSKMLCYYRNPAATKSTIDEDGNIYIYSTFGCATIHCICRVVAQAGYTRATEATTRRAASCSLSTESRK